MGFIPLKVHLFQGPYEQPLPWRTLVFVKIQDVAARAVRQVWPENPFLPAEHNTIWRSSVSLINRWPT